MPILPADISRCLGRRSMLPEAELCARRDTCLRHRDDMPQRAPGDDGVTPVDLWVCSDQRLAAYRRMPGTGGR